MAEPVHRPRAPATPPFARPHLTALEARVAVVVERLACAELADFMGAHAVAAAIRARGPGS